MYHKTLSYRIFSILNNTGLLFISLLCIIPLVHVLAISFSAKSAADANIVNLWPVDFTLEAYRKTIDNPIFLNSIWISIMRTSIGTALTLLLAFMAAYPLSRESTSFKARSYYSWIFVFAMVFNGGLVPFYMMIQNLNLMGSFWALVLPGAVNIYLTILMMNFFRGIPKELEEAAMIDGAGHFRVLFTIFLPVSKPAIATLSLFSIVFHWNSWFDGLLYTEGVHQYPLATFLQTVIISRDMSSMSLDPVSLALISQKTVSAAQIFIGALPVLIIYPFLQKFFVKGLVVGSVKE
ncbi:putative aldouronate transport system permease protein [Paenibacillus algorifonticola]|uniref:ABC transporter permease n=2 Tax=Paenibacillus TaxID=44249 RepID=A0A1B2DEM1_9BACL|nr:MULTISPECIES: carbohydrate ABC transporter permease [Paenibacillus]ANY66129.1 ABC transporter permease [Paenibacillus sp. BIHB 4019]KQO18538.1 ABC transporter permease [Paenibacillus sp. Leaf72]SFE77399.1 putative aldouronate transport system permease protein [Paenibacillus algorifonticola]